ncbi:MAG: N-acetyltransferase [Chloroflexi bacterium]|nr:N-acetyltransferase [Chloroflexota bacterium]
MSANIRIEPVTDKKGVLEYVKFPFQLYRGDPNWVPPLIEERRDFFDPKKNPFYEHARFQLFLARRDGELVGTIGAVVNDNHNTFHNEQSGGFGFFEAINDPAVADALFKAAEDWVRGQGMTVIRGPFNFSTNDEVGTLIEGFDEPPMVMMTYNPRYYPALIEGCGYTKAMDLFAWIFDIAESLKNAPEKLFRVAEKAAEREGIRVRKVDMRHLDHEIAVLKQVYNSAWERNWGFVPMTEHEMDHLVNGMKAVIDPNLLFVAETADGTPAGISIGLPDLHQALRWSGGGHQWPFGLLKFLWHRRKVNQVRLIIMGMVEQYRGRGIDSLFYLRTAQEALKHGYKRLEGSWILESNDMMNRILERLGASKYKTYRIYEKAL